MTEMERAFLGAADYVMFALMLLVSAGIGIYFMFAGGKQKTTEEFLLAGKDMSVWPVAFSLMASFLSAITVIGTPAEMYRFGVYLAYMNIGFVLGTVLSAYLFVPVYFDLQVSTAYEFLERRFGKRTRSLCSFVFVSQMILYMAVVLYAPALALSAVTNLSTWISVVAIGAVCTFYCTLGGMKAVLWTDVFQAVLMYLGLFAVLIKGCLDVGGVGEVFRIASEGGRLVVPGGQFDFTTRYTMLNVVLSGLILSLSAYGSNQVQVQRLLTVKNVTKSRVALFLHLPMAASFHLLNCFAGLVIYANFYKCDPLTSPLKPITSSDQLMPYFMMQSLADYPGLPGLCICGVFSASLSTVSSAVNSLSAVTMEDFVRPLLNTRGVTQTKAAFLAKTITLLYGALCILLTFLVARFGNLVQASLTVFGMLGGPVLGVFTLGMMTKRSNEKGVILGLISSIAFCAWMCFGATRYAPPPKFLPTSTESCIGNHTGTAWTNATTTHFDFTTTTLADVVTEPIVTEDEMYVFPLYLVSYAWVTPLGFFITVVLGYLSSFPFSWASKGDQKVEDELLSPMVRWLFSGKSVSGRTGSIDITIKAPEGIKVPLPEVTTETASNGTVTQLPKLTNGIL